MILYNPKLPKLTHNQQLVLDLLVKAAILIEPLYEAMTFYPKDIRWEEIEEAAKKDPDILSPYTVVEKKEEILVAVPYHVKYREYLEPIAYLLKEAAEVSDSIEFANGLNLQAKVLLDGNYDEATIYWMEMKPYVLDINIGPVERYDDKLFFTKTSYQAWVGVMDIEMTQTAQNYKDLILSARRKALMPSEKVDYYDQVQVRIDDILIFSGFVAKAKFIGVNLPNDVRLMERYGSEITLFKQTNETRMEDEIVPTFNKIFSLEFKKLFSHKDLDDGGLGFNILHELAHVYLRYRNSERNLKDLFPYVDELAAYVMGIKVCGSLYLKDIASQHQLESIIVAFLSKCYFSVLNEEEDEAGIHYTVGYAIVINYLKENDALLFKDGVSWPNFTKIFLCLDQLSEILERLLSSGSREDAASLIRQYGDIKKAGQTLNE